MYLLSLLDWMSQQSHLVVEFQEIPKEQTIFSLHWDPKEAGNNTSEGKPQQQDRRTC